MTFPKYFIGIDISKLTLDVALFRGNAFLHHVKIANTEGAIVDLLKTFKKDFGCTRFNSFYCCEHMGIYATFLLKICLKKKLVLCQESPLQIKRSLGIQRGKNDQIDSMRIAEYASKNYLGLKIWQPPRPEVEKIKMLSALRRKLLRLKLSLTGNQKNELYYLDKKELKDISQYIAPSLHALTQTIATIETEIDTRLKADDALRHLFKLITSVPGIGKVVATELIICTNEFAPYWTAKKFASYCGIAPFERLSGTSVRGKTRVSAIANKEVKSLLHLASLLFARYQKSFLGGYYARKVAEGKNKMSVLNAIRNKLVHRIFSCVRNNKPFTDYELRPGGP